ncbi:DUF4855 domain-containing protein [Streptomyces melanogenes]|uniref:DUF4855 domain-containing protein n=1 Tax=Streptomyces melanogenes TaxID=67326 RepID=UPI00167CAE79|nr:DUF4855 domain-containing protein [Streptomyces melanogenes]GGP89377.1 hypothetical protein GCM10010278_79800 [Streptomyces melanogenes]
MRLLLSALLAVLVLAPHAAAGPVPGPGFLTPEQAGFHHAALLYDERDSTASGNRGKAPEPMENLVAQHRGGRPVRNGWLFDAFVKLRFTSPSGQKTDYGATNAADWQSQVDSWLGVPGNGRGQIGRLDDALVETAATLADDDKPMGPPATPRKVILALPWPSPEQHAFGTVDGAPADFAKEADRTRAVSWYTRLIKERFAAGKYRHLQLWGLYFMREDALGSDPQWLQAATATVHDQGLKALWIPYADAPGAENAGIYGFDATFLQPSYAFTSPQDGGQVSASRLRSTAHRAQHLGLGMEMEVRRAGTDGTSRRVLRQYLAEGNRLGYQKAATAWFLGTDPNLWGGNASAFTDIADYVLGRQIVDDDVHPYWTWSGTSAETAFPARNDLRSLRVDLGENAANWTGTVRVEAHTPKGWEPAGWAVSRPPETIDAVAPALTVPLAEAQQVRRLRVTFSPQVPPVDRMTPDTTWTWPPDAPAEPRAPAAYPDVPHAVSGDWTAGKLTDGQWAPAGWQGEHAVGWSGWVSTTNIALDLGRPRSLTQVTVRTHGGGSAGVNWPRRPSALLSDCPLPGPAGTGPLPCAVQPLRADPPQAAVTGGTDPDLAGTIGFPVQTSTPARYLTVSLGTHGWLMVDEIEAIEAGSNANAALHAPYRFSPPPAGR